jgi:hypothetical protein
MNAPTAPSEFWPAPRPSGRPATTSTRWAAAGDAGEGDAPRASVSPTSGRFLQRPLERDCYRCIGERRKRYENANELIAPRAARLLKTGVLRSLKDVHLAFTGILHPPAPRPRRRGGPAIVHGAPSSKTTVVVRGRPNPLQAAGREGGLKLMEIMAAAREGSDTP